MGALLLAGGEKGKRFSLNNSRIMIHQPLGGFRGRQPISIYMPRNPAHEEEAERDSGSSYRSALEKVEADTERDYFMSSEDARNYGIIDSAVTGIP